jgi:ABC-type transport system substrate-binding protein
MSAKLARAAAVGLALSALAVSSCTGPSSSSSKGNSSINVYLYQEPVGLFGPLAPASGPDIQVMSFIDEGLLAADPKYKLQPTLAESYDISTDAKTFTFHLRKGLKWSDGQPFSSADVLFTYQRMADAKSGSATAGNYSNVAGATDFAAGKAATISGFTAPDANTFVIKAATPDVGLVAQLGSVYIMPKHILGSVPVASLAKDKFFRAPTVGMGPYKFVEYKTNQFVHVTANQNYRAPASIKDVYLKPMTSDVATAQLGNGGIDISSFSPTDLKTVQGLNTVNTQQINSAGFVRIAINQTKPYFQDPRVRQAFLYAVNRQALVDKVLFGKAKVQNSDFYAGNTPSGINTYAYDPAKAKQLLQAAGWKASQTVNLEWVPGQRDRDATATIIQNQLGAVGVKVALKQVQAAQITPNLDNKSYDMLLYGGGNYAVDSASVHAITACALRYPKGANQNFFCDPALDTLMTKANATADPTQRKQIYDQAAIEENSKADLFWLYSPMGLWAINKRITGFQAAGSQEFPYWRPGSWKITG